ncbi:unnamed protein product [Fraxinus pennsylvanica]|uniref:Uncharacterized protein n=1 Tax=Fraxinus pennsylvanica TaxID=56036 RepID=A0AAD1ZKC2_9LAMI|nr:unnamed protein product [Fraxinus pennsylvanica]
MKYFGLLVLFLVIGTVGFTYLGYSSHEDNASLNPGIVSIHLGNVETFVKRRKLKENSNTPHSHEDDEGNASLEDYRPIDPVPSSKASVRPGPIQHGTPLMPFIPWSAPPPGQTEHGATP